MSGRITLPKRAAKKVSRLPAILTGKNLTPEEQQVHDKFWAVFVRELLRRMVRSYQNRSLGKSDDLPGWQPLKPSTIRKKSKLKGRSHLARRINYRTGNLQNSFSPGRVAGTNYFPVENQKVVFTASRILVGSSLPYAERVSKLRDLFPSNPVIGKWAAECGKIALESVASLLGK